MAALAVVSRSSADETKVHFNRDIRPILSNNCFACHGPGEAQGDLRLDTFEGATEWSVVPGDAAGSELMARVLSHDPELRMPSVASKKPALTEKQITLLRRWIDDGAEYEPHWSYLPVERPDIAGDAQDRWSRSPIDRLLLARIRDAGVEPSGEADRVTLVRRLYLDLIGLPPTPAQVDAFIANKDPQAYEQLVDELLVSTHYGERMATWWFDLVRFANTVGYHGDQEHNITPYRDYVLKSLNDNLPFDQFTIEQIAGDLLPPSGDEAADMWRMIATGYNRVLQTTHEGGAQDKEYRAKTLADRVRNVSEVWLGTSMGCAECHDHKFDPFTTKDFYAMAALFADVDHHGSYEPVSQNTTPTRRPPEALAWTLPVYEQLKAVDSEITGLEAALGAGLPRDFRKKQQRLIELKRQRADLEGRFVPTVVTRAVKKPRTIRVLPRGNWQDDSGKVVAPNMPEFFVGTPPRDRRLTRLDLAKWLVSKDNPLTPRVITNRLWKLFYGEGISSDLIEIGSQGQWPTHPELLDWLSAEFVESGWDLKHMVRLMVTSSAYRQMSLPRDDLNEKDPANRLLARQSRFRLEAEQVRDLAMQASGLLVHQFGGDFGKPYQPVGYYAQLNFPTRTYTASKGANQYRRAVYTHWQRQFVHPWLKAFDAPSREECTAKRPISNTPAAALVLLNDPTFVEAARGLAARTLSETLPADDAPAVAADAYRLRWAWRQVTSRAPNDEEVNALAGLLNQQREHFAKDAAAAEAILATGDSPPPEGLDKQELASWMSVCRVLLNLSETITRN